MRGYGETVAERVMREKKMLCYFIWHEAMSEIIVM